MNKKMTKWTVGAVLIAMHASGALIEIGPQLSNLNAEWDQAASVTMTVTIDSTSSFSTTALKDGASLFCASKQRTWSAPLNQSIPG